MDFFEEDSLDRLLTQQPSALWTGNFEDEVEKTCYAELTPVPVVNETYEGSFLYCFY